MARTVAVAWFERDRRGLVVGERQWCRALRKTTTAYQDNVRTLCGFTITAPVGLSMDEVLTCEECLAKEEP